MATSSSRKISSICILGGCKFGNSGSYCEVANKLGTILAERKINIVYGGGALGLIGNVALRASFGGSRIIGVVFKAIKEFLGTTIGHEIEVPSIQDRIPKMLEHSDAVIALPGGFNTFEDIFHIAAWLALGIHAKPIGILNINGYYDGLLTLLDHAVDEGFMTEPLRQIFISDPDPVQLIEKLQGFEYKYASVASQFDWFGDRGKKRKADDLDLRLTL